MSYLTNDSMVSRIYTNFRGVDFRGEEINLARSPDSLNVWKDYRETESIRTRPGLALQRGSGHVYGIFWYKGSMLLHTGTRLEKITGTASVTLYENMAQKPSQGFVFDDIFYIKDGVNYLKYDGKTASKVVGYVPTTSIARKPMGGGTQHEEVNMLSDRRKNSFLADGASFDFFLDVMNIDEDFVPIVTVNDQIVEADKYTVHYAEGRIQFITTPPDAPLTDGQDNVVVEFKKAVPKYENCINGCTMLQVFDNRVFFSGNPDFPNMIWHCSLNDPSYCSDLDYYREGMDEAAVRGMVAGNNALWVFREPSHANTTVFYHTPTIDEQYGKIYPSAHSSITTGCIGKAINFGDDIIFFSERGMEGISGDVTTEQVVAHRSSLVDRKLIAESGYREMLLEEWEGYLLVITGKRVYLADSRAIFTYENHSEYDWFYWELEKEITCTSVYGGVLYLGTAEGVYTLSDFSANVKSYWTTPKDKFKHPHKLKTTNKKGCVAEATGDIKLYAKVEDTDFELVGEFNFVRDYFVGRIKRKKWKDIQLKFASDTRFSLETVTLEAYVGAYIKR